MFYIMLRKSGSTPIDSTYGYLTDIEAGTGSRIKKSFATLAEAETYVQGMIESGTYSLGDFIVTKGVTVSATIALTEETP